MKKMQPLMVAAAVLGLSIPMTALAKTVPAPITTQVGKGALDYQETIGNLRVTFKFVSMKEHMQAAGIEMPKDMKETHHLKVDFLDAKTGKPFTEGEVKVKVQGPDKVAQVKDLVAMNNRFCSDLDLSKKGKYGVMTKFQLKGREVQSIKFWYTVK
ncbi:hypothetical protein KP001_09170 [Geomonas subterranea]|uniref:DUF4426 domain-containing protein n=1 Tax=Geomonas subterranea TaxID=2847989 RepID=A0ABX8LQ02_9BACT|nr:hypothetical protein [Geomonas subterranea]QXE92669.1 hypothetical protein KP001_09170 [Geomonas subterranea]QXM09232.1 hypothetical protein KP002_20105 [Geomonas subterranea]